jgi:hypothetical protein
MAHKYLNFEQLDIGDELTQEEVTSIMRQYALFMHILERGDTSSDNLILYEDVAFVFDLGNQVEDFAIIRQVGLDTYYDEDSEETLAYGEVPRWYRASLRLPASDLVNSGYQP